MPSKWVFMEGADRGRNGMERMAFRAQEKKMSPEEAALPRPCRWRGLLGLRKRTGE